MDGPTLQHQDRPRKVLSSPLWGRGSSRTGPGDAAGLELPRVEAGDEAGSGGAGQGRHGAHGGSVTQGRTEGSEELVAALPTPPNASPVAARSAASAAHPSSLVLA